MSEAAIQIMAMVSKPADGDKTGTRPDKGMSQNITKKSAPLQSRSSQANTTAGFGGSLSLFMRNKIRYKTPFYILVKTNQELTDRPNQSFATARSDPSATT